MPAERSTERLRRILVLVPWVMANPGAGVGEVCERFSMTREELSADLELLFVCGLPPFGPGDLIEAFIEGDEVIIGMADYLSKPPRLTRAEAIGLLVMGRALLGLPGLEEAPSLQRALDKLAAAVAPAEAEQARGVAARVAVDLASAGADMLGDIRAAIRDRARIRVSYYSQGRAEMNEREIEPLLAFSAQGYWYVVAMDPIAMEERIFRIDRMKDLARTGVHFEQPAGFDPGAYANAALFTPSSRDIDVVIDAGPAAAWMTEFIPHEEARDLGDGRTRISLRTPHLEWLVRLLLGAGSAARAVSPPELQRAVGDAAARALSLYR